MHPEAWEFIEQNVYAGGVGLSVVEFGSRYINGGVRSLFRHCRRYVGIDALEGPGVDVVADVTEWRTEEKFDRVVCCEVLEHSPRWEDIIASAWHALDTSGVLLLTAATDPRAPHSAIDGGGLREGEYYGNVPVEALRAALMDFEIAQVSVHPRGDVYARAVK